MKKMAYVYSLLVVLTLLFFSTPSKANDVDKLNDQVKEQTQEVIDKNKDGTDRLIERTEVNTQNAIDDVKAVPEKNEAGTDRLVARTKKNAEGSSEDIKNGINHATQEVQQEIDAVIAKNAPATQPDDLTARQTTLTETTTLKSLPTIEIVQDLQDRGITLNPSLDFYYYSIDDAVTTADVTLAPGTQLELIKVVPAEEANQLNRVLAALNTGRTEETKLCGRTSVFTVANADVQTVNIHRFTKCP